MVVEGLHILKRESFKLTLFVIFHNHRPFLLKMYRVETLYENIRKAEKTENF